MNEEMETMGESEAEIEVGSYVCSRSGAGPRGSVVEIEADERGADYDILHVRPFPYVPHAASQRCQRAVMMRPYPRPVPSRLDYADTPQGDDRFGAALLVCCAERDAVIEGHKAALALARAGSSARHADLCRTDKLLSDTQDSLESLRADHAALTDTFNEVNAAYYKVNADHNKAQEDLAKLKQELASVTQARDMATTLMHRRQAEHDAACENARKIGDELQALRGHLASVQAAESEECARLRAVIKDISEMCSTHVRSLMFAKREAARQERRADAWQIAAQDALSQMEEIRAIRNGDEPCGKG